MQASSLMGVIQRVQWCQPEPDHFYTYGSECIALHQFAIDKINTTTNRAQGLPVLPSYTTHIVARQSDIGAPKCFAPKPDDIYQVAHGHVNGTVNVTDLSSGLTGGRAILPCKHAQAAVHVAWNSANTNLLASAHERHKGSASVYVWDVQQQASAPLPPSGSYTTEYHLSTLPRPLHELAVNESAVCCTWMPNKPHSLIVGLKERSGIRVFDLRDRHKPCNSLSTKCIYGITVDPTEENYVCSYSPDRAIVVFDLRNAGNNNDKPVLTINTNSDILKVVWNGRQALCTLLNQTQYIRQHVLQNIGSSGETELLYSDRHTFVSFSGESRCKDVVTDFDVHPSDSNCYLALSNTGSIKYTTDSSISRWDRDGRLIVCFDRTIWDCDDLTSCDMNQVMRDRAQRNYGLQSGAAGLGQMREVLNNDINTRAVMMESAGVIGDDTHLVGARDALYWLSLLASLHEKTTHNKATWPYDKIYPSVSEILHKPLDGGGSSTPNSGASLPSASADRASQIATKAESRGFDDTQPMRMVYTSSERTRVIELCGWQTVSIQPDPMFTNGVMNRTPAANSSEVYLLDLARHHPGKACAIALFTLRCQLAVKILARAALEPTEKPVLLHLQEQYRLTAMALGGFQAAVSGLASAKDMWEQMCASVMNTVTEPYLHAVFEFLLVNSRTPHHSSDQYAPIVDNTAIPLHDRLAFACIHLPDHPLIDQIDKWTTESIKMSKLDGIALTGLRADSASCLELFHSYVDMTSDVQTAALLLIHGRCFRRASSSTSATPTHSSNTNEKYVVSQLVEVYESLLNSWQLWHARAQLDSLKTKLQPGKHDSIPAQVYLRCAFCSQPATAMQRPPGCHNLPGMPSSAASRATKLHNGSVGACVNCNKPLPRCALCRMHMASTNNATSPINEEWNTGQENRSSASSMNNRFGNWFSWCQSCRHGGHVHHLAEWFETNTDCPVVNCKCKCTQLDVNTPFVI